MIDLDVNSMYAGTVNVTKFLPKFFKSRHTIVDGERWYDVGVRDIEVSEWIRSTDKQFWVETTVPYPSIRTFDIHEKLYMMLVLRWA